MGIAHAVSIVVSNIKWKDAFLTKTLEVPKKAVFRYQIAQLQPARL